MTALLKEFVHWLCEPTVFVTLGIVVFFTFFILRRFFATRAFASVCFPLTLLLLVVSCANDNFRAIVLKPDNVPIAAMVLMTVFFSWYALRQAYINDERTRAGQLAVEAEPEQKQRVYTWPNLVYIELLAMIAVTVVLIFWSVYLKAPLEQPAHPSRSPNPAKAPWYFLGLQEMLVYFDPWLAGVVVPGLIIAGLMAIPYLDTNPKGNGYYCYQDRKFAVLSFNFGWLVLWILLIVIGTFLRGPNWNFFDPFEYWDVHKLPPLTNINLSEVVYAKLLGVAPPRNILLREGLGLLLVAAYFVVLPPVLAKTLLRKIYQQVGTTRFYVMSFFLLAMAALPIKMYLRWVFNLKYIVSIPEYFFNI